MVETLFAIILYWWIAIRFETHWHLVTSVFIAPMLLLRSPESIATGIRWFLNDWFGMSKYRNWPLGTRRLWIIACGLITGCLPFVFANLLSRRWLAGLEGWRQDIHAAMIGVVAIIIGFAISFFGMGVLTPYFRNTSTTTEKNDDDSQLAGLLLGPIVGANLGIFIWGGWNAIDGALFGTASGPVLILVLVSVFPQAFGVSIAIRALIFGMCATLANVFPGILRLPANWKENIFIIDSLTPIELLPDIRKHEMLHSSDGMWIEISKEQTVVGKYILVVMWVFLFLPSFLYRLNIKATAWFWWPLAYLLKPTPVAGAEGAQRQALCWPSTDPVQRFLIVLSIGLALFSLVLHWLEATSRIESGLITSLPLAVRVLLGWGWTRLTPWHGALWIIAAASAGMLLLAGNACSHHANDNWSQYRQRWPQNIFIMTTLSRIRRLATIALLVMSLGSLLLQDRTWQAYVPVPDSWVMALENFYQ